MTLRAIATAVGLLFALEGWGAAWASGPLTGRVLGKGRPIPGATVVVRASGQQWSTVTEESGEFQIAEAAAASGPMSVEVRMFGFQPLRREVSAEERERPLELGLTMVVLAQRQTSAPAAGVADPLAGMAQEALGGGEQAAADPTQANEALLIQGSLSRGLENTARSGGRLDAGLSAADSGEEATAAAAAAGGAAARTGRVAQTGSKKMDKLVKKDQKATVAAASGPQTFGNRRTTPGRNAMQGMVYMGLRNSALDATPYSVNGAAVQKPSYAQSRFGMSLGGALRIPKILENSNAFFFLNYQGTRSRNPYSNFGVVPTEAERNGDFSASRTLAIFDPQTGQPFPNKQIPASRLDPVSQGLLPYVPLPNFAGSIQNYQLVTSYPQNSDNLSVRLNKGLSTRDRLAAGINLQRRDGENVQLFGFRDASGGSGGSYDLTWNHTFTPRLIHNLRFRYNLNKNTGTPFFAYGPDVAGQLGINGSSREPVNYGPPNLNFTNFGDLTDGIPLLRRIHTWTYGSGWTWVKGKHTLTAGFELQRLQWNTVTEQNARGTLFFGGLVTSGFDAQGNALVNTGFDFADYLLGRPQQSTLRFDGADTYMRASTYSAYAQDDWRVKSNLSVNLGMRYEYFAPFQEKYGRLSNLDIAPGFTAAAVVTPGMTGPYSGPLPKGLIDGDSNNFAPRIGVAWKPWGKRHVVRAGYGIYFDGSVYSRIPTRLAAQPPFAQASTFQISVDNVLTMNEPFVGPADVNIKNTYAVDRHYLVPYAQTCNAAVQLNLPNGMFAEMGYLGTKGTRLVLQRQPNRSLPGSATDSEDRRPITNAVGFTYDSTEGNSTFHAAQFRFVKRMRKGVALNAFYQWSKSIDNASSIGGGAAVVVQDDQNFAAERGLSAFDKRHQLNVNAVVNSPFGPRGYFLEEPGFWSVLLRSWTASVGMTASTGTPLTARVLGNVADSAGTGSTGSSRASATGLPIDAGSGYFNTAAFMIPRSGTYGNAARNTIPGPGLFSLDASLGRTFQIGENSRRRLELRAESENVLNKVNLTSYGTVVNAVDYGLATRAGQMRSFNVLLRYRF